MNGEMMMKRAATLFVAIGCLSMFAAVQMGGCGGGGAGAETGASKTGTENHPGGNFSVLSYNVAGLLEGISQSQPSVFTPLISPLLNGYDLVLVQEDFFYHAELASDATHPHQSSPQAATSTLSNDGLNRFSFFPFTEFERQTWEECHGWVASANDCLASKGFSFARHEISPGVFLDVYNLHADAGGSAHDVETRRNQFNQLVAYIDIHSAGNAVIVAGDTNLTGYDPDDEPVLQNLMVGAGLADSARFLGEPERIDRILFRSSANLFLEPTSWRIAAEFVDSSGTPLSDHEALHVEMNWTLLP